jgi:hypothetical protein
MHGCASRHGGIIRGAELAAEAPGWRRPSEPAQDGPSATHTTGARFKNEHAQIYGV